MSGFPAFLRLLLFVGTVIWSSALLFCVQPFAAKALMPRLGGTASVWNCCQFFFQAVLVAGYGYGHLLPSLLGLRRHAAIHLALMLLTLPLLFLVTPGLLANGTTSDMPLVWLLWELTTCLGLPFLIVATSSPLLQRWFAGDHGVRKDNSGDPYFLYAASNAGSLAGLLAYPLLVEPWLSLPEQHWWGTLGFVGLCASTALCALALMRATTEPRHAPDRPPAAEAGPETSPVAWQLRMKWLLWSALPSGLLMNVTTYLSVNISPMPLIWVLPLSLYLLTFISAFGSRQLIPQRTWEWLTPRAALIVLLTIVLSGTEPWGLLTAIHLAGFYIAARSCHGRLAATRPPPAQLTEFYLWLAIGGVLGSLLNAFLAPFVFPGLWEYPLSLACVAGLKRGAQASGNTASHAANGVPRNACGRPRSGTTFEASQWAALRNSAQYCAGPLAVSFTPAVLQRLLPTWSIFGADRGNWRLEVVAASFACYLLIDRPRRFALGLLALMAAATACGDLGGKVIHRQRDFYGIHCVVLDQTGPFHLLCHGNTVHGRQCLDRDKSQIPLSYYCRSGPIGDVFRSFDDDPRLRRVGVVGLGAGTLAAYARPGQQWTFYELDPAVAEIAQNPNFFTYLKDCRAAARIVLGDARMTLQNEPDGSLDLLVIDAFTSDAIPTHLLTREAFELYSHKLSPGGLLAINVSNRYSNLEPVIADVAASQTPPWTGISRTDSLLTAEEQEQGKSASQWIVLAERGEQLGRIAQGPSWARLTPRPGRRPWTDDWSNVLETLRWQSGLHSGL